jgi:hypothetical protein
MRRSADKQAAIRAAVERRRKLLRALDTAYLDMIASSYEALERSRRLLDETAAAVRDVKMGKGNQA